MAQADAATKIQADIPLGVVEYVIAFKAPIFDAWKELTRLIPAVLANLDPFGFKFDGVEIKQPEKLSEHLIVFRRGSGSAFTFNVGVGRMWFYAENLDWSEADQAIPCMGAGIAAVKEVSNCEVSSQTLTLAMHVQFKDKPVASVTAPLLSSAALGLLDGEVKVHGIILIRDKATILIDASAGFANAIFVKIVREHSASTKLSEVAERLRKDEITLFDTLGISTGTL
jgi:hypothetical protein